MFGVSRNIFYWGGLFIKSKFIILPPKIPPVIAAASVKNDFASRSIFIIIHKQHSRPFVTVFSTFFYLFMAASKKQNEVTTTSGVGHLLCSPLFDIDSPSHS